MCFRQRNPKKDFTIDARALEYLACLACWSEPVAFNLSIDSS